MCLERRCFWWRLVTFVLLLFFYQGNYTAKTTEREVARKCCWWQKFPLFHTPAENTLSCCVCVRGWEESWGWWQPLWTLISTSMFQKSRALKAQELWGLSGSGEEKTGWVSNFLLLFIYQCAHTMWKEKLGIASSGRRPQNFSHTSQVLLLVTIASLHLFPLKRNQIECSWQERLAWGDSEGKVRIWNVSCLVIIVLRWNAGKTSTSSNSGSEW